MTIFKSGQRELRKVVRWLRRNFPLSHPTQVRWADLRASNNFGECEHRLLPERFIIRIDASLSDDSHLDMLLDTAVEEWSHALRFHIPFNQHDRDHDEIYAAIHGRIRAAWLGEIGLDPYYRGSK